MSKHPRRKARPVRQSAAATPVTSLRIIGGQLRGRSFRYNGDPGLRPMKDRVREAVFNLLGPRLRGCKVVDLFGGTGAMAFEAVSRGARAAIVIERRFPNARLIRDNAAALGISELVTVRAGDAFVVHRELEAGNEPWLVFCCPPYELYLSRQRDLLEMLERLHSRALAGSLFVVESDERFDAQLLPQSDPWDVRHYAPAVIAISEKTRSESPRLTQV